MQPSTAYLQRRVHSGSAGAGTCSPKLCALRASAKPGRRPCKPVCFKEGDKIDDATTRRPPPATTSTPTPTTPTGATPSPLYGTAEPSTTAGLRAVALGPVATLVYPALTGGTAAAVLAATLAPGVTGSLLFRGATLTATQKLLLFAAGAALIPSLVSKRRIQLAAETGVLASPVFKQMVSACLLHGVLGLVVLSQAVSLRNPILAGTVGGLTGLATITTSYTLMKIRESGQLLPSARGLLGGALSVLTPANLTATAYSVITLAAAAAGALLFMTDPFTAPAVFLEQKDAIHVFAARITGAATLATSVLLATVKQAADDGRQGSPAFRDITAGVAAASVLTTGALLYAIANGLAQSSPATWSYLAFTTATGLLTAYNWYTAPQ